MKIVILFLVNLYQRTLSPDHGWFKSRYPYGYCRFYPSCSEYARQAIERHGVVTGVFLGIKRIFKCNPWAQPKIDN